MGVRGAAVTSRHKVRLAMWLFGAAVVFREELKAVWWFIFLAVGASK